MTTTKKAPQTTGRISASGKGGKKVKTKTGKSETAREGRELVGQENEKCQRGRGAEKGLQLKGSEKGKWPEKTQERTEKKKDRSRGKKQIHGKKSAKNRSGC